MTVPGVGQIDLNALIAMLRSSMPQPGVGGFSDPLAQAYLQTSTQQNIAAITQAIQLAQQEQANRLRQSELMGADPTGTPTDAAARWRAELLAQQQVQDERLRQQLLQLTGFNSTTGESTVEGRQQEDQSRQRWAEITGVALGGGETLAARQLAQEADLAERERLLRQALQSQQLTAEASEGAAERNLRMLLQGGQLGQQEAEFARNYLLQQDASRRAQAELTGYTDTGALTEDARARRAAEAQQRAATAADLTRNSRDIFRAGQYFREMRGADPTGTGLMTDAGPSGFTTAANRAMGTPGTMTYADVDAALGIGSPSATGLSAPSAMQALPVATGGMTMTPGNTAGGTDVTNGESLIDPNDPTEREGYEQADGTQPGGPLGMGAGGSFIGRRRSTDQVVVTPDMVDDPRVQKFFRQIQAQRKGGKSRPGTQPGGPVGGRAKTFGGELARNERALRGLRRMLSRRGATGTQPGGPVDAPLWPTGAAATPMPTLQTAASTGGGDARSMMSASALPASYGGIGTSAGSQLGQFAAADTAGLDSRLAAMSEYLRRYGIQGMGAQEWERMNSTEKGVREAAFEALGLNNEDADEAYAQTRFRNIGNALLA